MYPGTERTEVTHLDHDAVPLPCRDETSPLEDNLPVDLSAVTNQLNRHFHDCSTAMIETRTLRRQYDKAYTRDAPMLSSDTIRAECTSANNCYDGR